MDQRIKDNKLTKLELIKQFKPREFEKIINSEIFRNLILDPDDDWIERKNDQSLTIDSISDFSKVSIFLKKNSINPMMKNILSQEFL